MRTHLGSVSLALGSALVAILLWTTLPLVYQTTRLVIRVGSPVAAAAVLSQVRQMLDKQEQAQAEPPKQ